MDKYYIYVAGYGETSRANVEALIEDYVYANGNEVVFVFVYDNKPTSGMAYISQWAKDKGKDIVIFANPNAKFDGLSAATVNETTDPYNESVKFLNKDDKAVGFILWSDDDQRSSEIVSAFNEKSVKCFDLTDGLNILNVTLEKIEEPRIPEAEMILDAPVEEDEDEEELDEWDEEEDEDDELMDDVFFGLQALVKAIAREVINQLEAEKRLKKPSKKPSKGV